MTDAFTFDAKACSGCKACQAACKDKNNLPAGVLWRRVIEVSGGEWKREGAAWNNTVFAYNLSIACNHCVHPKCAGVCPTNAYVTREDGIVFLDTTKCMGCGYCAWACPYGAPQYDPQSGSMTKCDLCIDRLAQGLAPACVAACPMRVLDYGDVQSMQAGKLWDMPPERHPFPLPAYSRTQPRLAIKPHPAMGTAEKKSVANQEEIQPRRPSDWEDVPLVLFTLLAQMAVGGFWALTWMLVPFASTPPLPLLLIGACFGAGMLASFAHLGRKTKARYALRNLRKSSLSREILFAGLFGMGWLFTALESVVWHRSSFEGMAVTAILGIGLIYNMSQVYRFPAAPGWHTWRTNASFLLSALLLGHALMAPWLVLPASSGQWAISRILIIGLLLAQLILMRRQAFDHLVQKIRMGLIGAGIGLTAISFLPSGINPTWMSTLIFLIVLAEEGLGRWSFYRSRLQVTDPT